jgi:hypothetical protein
LLYASKLLLFTILCLQILWQVMHNHGRNTQRKTQHFWLSKSGKWSQETMNAKSEAILEGEKMGGPPTLHSHIPDWSLNHSEKNKRTYNFYSWTFIMSRIKSTITHHTKNQENGTHFNSNRSLTYFKTAFTTVSKKSKNKCFQWMSENLIKEIQ